MTLLLTGCSFYGAKKHPLPSVDVPKDFSVKSTSYIVNPNWWDSFRDPRLSELVDTLLSENFDLKAAFNRVQQAEEVLKISKSAWYPSLSSSSAAARNRNETGSQKAYSNQLSTSGLLSYELDIWGKIASGVRASDDRLDAQFQSLREIKLIQVKSLIDTYFEVLRQKELGELVSQQIKTTKEFLELTELRFRLGNGNAVDVLQQRALLAGLKVLQPQIERDLQIALNSLSVLTGKPPGQITTDSISTKISDPPIIEATFAPVELLHWRPDLRVARHQLEASEHDLAAAIADRLPSLSIDLTATFSAESISRLFTEEILQAATNLVLPIIDGGRRRAEVRRQDAIVNELINSYSSTFLNALSEVEAAIVSFSKQAEIVELISNEVRFSRQSLNESRNRYINGLSNYLSVLIELQRLQEAERRLINEKINYNLIRTRLYRALGGVQLLKVK